MKERIKITLTLLSLVTLLAFTYTKKVNNFTILEKKVESVLYGNQEIMTTNLSLTKFRNGEDIPHSPDAKAWEKAGENKEPAWAYYNNDASTAADCGILYNWYAVNDPRGLAPEGWHIPTEKEWKQLGNYFSEKYPRNLSPIKSKSAWIANDNGDNSSGFNAFPCGSRGKNGAFNQFGEATAWWSASTDGGGKSSLNSLFFSFSSRFREFNVGQNTRGGGLSVRCMKD